MCRSMREKRHFRFNELTPAIMTLKQENKQIGKTQRKPDINPTSFKLHIETYRETRRWHKPLAMSRAD